MLAPSLPDRPRGLRARGLRFVLALVGPAVLGACAARPVNPTFPISVREAEEALAEMEAAPVPLERPVVVAGGYLDPHAGPWWVAKRLSDFTGDERFLTVSFFFCTSLEECRAKLIAAVDAAYPGADPLWTTEVDVVGISMGGLVARLAAADALPGGSCQRRLRIRRLFTLASPHEGARMAELPCFLPLHREMRAGSQVYASLPPCDASLGYEVEPYVLLGDSVVGAENAAPRGRAPHWAADRLLHPSHVGAALDPRFQADIARRLRGEEPFASTPGAALPRPEGGA